MRCHPGSSAHADITHLCWTIHIQAMSCDSLVFLRLAKVSLRGMRRLVAKLTPRDFFAIPLLENCSMREAAVALSFAMGLPVIHNHEPRGYAHIERFVVMDSGLTATRCPGMTEISSCSPALSSRGCASSPRSARRAASCCRIQAKT